MSEQAAISLFVAHSIACARSMPIEKARCFLKGLLLVGEEHPALDSLREVYADLCAVDEAQLRLFELFEREANS